MERWSSEHHAFAVECFFKNGDSATVTQRELRRRFNIGRNGKVPTRQTILNWVENFRLTASALPKKNSGRPRTVRTPENVERVRTAILQSPQRSARRHSVALHMSDRSVRRMLHMDLHFHPFKMQVVQQLLPRDLNQRMEFCTKFLEMIEAQPQFLSHFIMSDEAHFHLSGYVNKQNFRYWAQENPRLLHQHPLHSEKVTVWCGVSSFGIFGPYFFQDDNGRAVTVTSERYVAMLNDFLLPMLRQHNADLRSLWFQQDGATSHTARLSMQTVRRLFPGKVISRNGDVTWPSRSPDLSACDYFLWGYLKHKVYEIRPHSIEDLKESITTAIRQIPLEMLRKTLDSLKRRAETCVQINGAHLSDVIFKT